MFVDTDSMVGNLVRAIRMKRWPDVQAKCTDLIEAIREGAEVSPIAEVRIRNEHAAIFGPDLQLRDGDGSMWHLLCAISNHADFMLSDY